MRRVLRKIRSDVLPVLDGDIVALIKLVAGMIAQGPSPSEFKRRIATAKMKAATEVLTGLRDWSGDDPAILGYLYESLLESPDDRTKQGPRRRAGVFYTPSYIARFLVRAATDAVLSHDRAEPPRILDPACGGGAFLIAAHRELVRRYPGIDPRSIATGCLFGVDADPDAVHVAKMVLWLETGLDARDRRRLVSNIRQGDSLREFADVDRERYPIVVGNPPYRNVKRGISAGLRDFCKSHYVSARGQWDLAAPFVEMTLRNLLEPGGACGFILPNPILLAQSYEPIRRIILENDLVAFGPAGRPFDDPDVEASLVVIRAGRSKGRVATILDGRKGEVVEWGRKLPVRVLRRLPFRVFSHLADPGFLEPILDALDRGSLAPLGNFMSFTRGIECGKSDPRIATASPGGGTKAHPLIVGESVTPFFAHLTRYLVVDEDEQTGRLLKRGKLDQAGERLLLRRVAGRPIAAVAPPGALFLNTVYLVHGEGINAHSACALLNSSLFREIFRQMFAFDDELFPYLRVSQISSVPAPREALSDRKLAEWSLELHRIALAQSGLPGTGRSSRLLEKTDAKVRGMYERAVSLRE